MLTIREKSPLPKISPEENRTRDAVDSEPKHYQLSYSDPILSFFISYWIGVLVSVIAVFWATIPNPTRPRVVDSRTPYRCIG